MKFLLPGILLIVLLLTTCKPPQAQSKEFTAFTAVPCFLDDPAEYDEEWGTLYPENEPPKDTILRKITKTRKAFKPCRTVVYRAIYKDEKGNIITDNLIKTVPTGHRWEWQAEKQDEWNIQFQFSESDIEKSKRHILNSQLVEREWMAEEVTGVIENVEEVWMHPFRSNQYSFTEVAPFPKVEFPLKIGNEYSSGLSMGQGWGDWENKTVSSSYKVRAVEPLNLAGIKLDSCWHVVSSGTFELGESLLDFWFHEEYGFVRFEYTNYGGKTLEIEMVEVIDL